MGTEEALAFFADIASLKPMTEVLLIRDDPLGRANTDILLTRAESLGIKMGVENVSTRYAYEHLPILRRLKASGIELEDIDDLKSQMLQGFIEEAGNSVITPTTHIFNYNINPLFLLFTQLKEIGFSSWKVCFPLNIDGILPNQYETLLNV